METDAFIASMGNLTRIGSAPVTEEKEKTGTKKTMLYFILGYKCIYIFAACQRNCRGVSHVRNTHDALAITVQAPPSVQGLSPSQHPTPHPV